MNLLPFVIVIITILALFSTSQLERHVTGIKEYKIYTAYFKGLRAARNHKEEILYRALMAEGKKKKNERSSEPKPVVKEVEYFRKEKIGWKNGRLNLSSLIHDAQKWPQLKKVAVAYVNRLYRHLDFFPDDGKFAEKLIDALVVAYKEEESETPFHKIKIGNKFHEIFHKMAKGTQSYTLEEEGIPPFGDFFTFEKREKPPMFFQEANTTFLVLTLGQKETELLVKKEKEEVKASGCHKSSIDRNKLVQLLSNSPLDSQLLNLFDFKGGPASRNPGKYRDPKTRITVRAP